MQIYVPKLIKQKKFSVFPGFLTKTTKKEHASADRSKKAATEILRRLCPKRERPVYFVTRSSHLTMASMANIEMAQTMTKMLHVAEIEMRL